MKSKFRESKLRWLLPAGLLLFHIFYISNIDFYNIRILLHWACYVILFLYLLYLGDVKTLFLKFAEGIRETRYLLKVLLFFLLSFACAMFIVYYWSVESKPMYRLWQPLSVSDLILWTLLYTLLQPLIDNILYHRWLIGTEQTPSAKTILLTSVILRTYAETGLMIYPNSRTFPDIQLLSLAYFAVSVISALFYYRSSDESLSFTGEVLYRIALVITVFIGMPQLIPFIS